MIAPILDELSEERNDIKIVKVNVDNSSDIATKYGIMSIPTMILFKDGKEVNKNVGFLSKDEVINFINEK